MNSITVLLGNILNIKSGNTVFARFLGGIQDTVDKQVGNNTGESDHSTQADFWNNMLRTLASIADWLLPVIMILIGMVGAIYAVVLGVRYSQAESDEKKNEAKKKMINALVGVLIAILIMLVMMIILKNASVIKAWIMGEPAPVTQQ